MGAEYSPLASIFTIQRHLGLGGDSGDNGQEVRAPEPAQWARGPLNTRTLHEHLSQGS